MRIILDNGAYSLRNMGDVAMLQVAVQRVQEAHPGCEIMILTTAQELLQRYCPGAIPLSVPSRDAAYQSAMPFTSVWKERWIQWQLRCGAVPATAGVFRRAISSADAVLLGGGGFLNDLNPHQTRPVLRMLADAAQRGKPAAMLSQGLGPLDNPELITLLRRGCAAGTRVALRESSYGPAILSRAGLPPGKYSVTGDDALELAWESGAVTDGNALGFSVRQVGYSEISNEHLQLLSKIVRELSGKLDTSIVPLPISFNTHEADPDIISRVTGLPISAENHDTPQALIERISQCRVLLTGTYHAAVFALARGVPCVCFYVSPYYRSKMEGLAGQFPGGCAVIDLGSGDACGAVQRAVSDYWRAARANLCAGLCRAAEEQIQSGRRFYREIFKCLPGVAPAQRAS